MGDALAIGWYGKLPSLGDFASRRLSAGFIEAWDGWLAAGLADWRRRDPDGWLTCYLASPSRRFVLLPGVVPPLNGGAGGGVMAGVLMPSVDRVGRYFPLTLAFALPAGVPRDAARTADLLGLLAALDDAAADALHDDWTADRLDAELARLWAEATPRWLIDADAPRGPASYAGAAPAEPVAVQAHGHAPARAPALRGGADAFLAQAVRDGLAGSPPRRAWWLAGGHGDAGDAPPTPTTFHDTAGLPSGADFIALWGGRPSAEPPPR